MKKIVKLVPNTFEHESRDLRELKCLYEMGNTDIIVVGKGVPSIIKKSFYEFHALKTRPIKYFPKKLNRVISVFVWAKYVKNLNADIISCHDLICLGIAYIATLFTGNKPKLVYDSHEFELGRNGRNNKLMLLVIKLIEGILIKKTAFSIMVTDSIADEMQRIYKLNTRPLVIRNIPDIFHNMDSNLVKECRKHYNDLFNLKNDDFIVLYHGAIMSGRGIENTIMAMINTSGIKFIILGYGDEEYINDLKKLISDNNVADRIFFHKSVPIDELWRYLASVDVSIVMVENICLSYYYSLPNKFFESIQAQVPIIGTNLPEIKVIIEKYDIGILCEADSSTDIRNAIIKCKTDVSLYNKFKENLKKASQELNWKNEKKKLIEAYSKIL